MKHFAVTFCLAQIFFFLKSVTHFLKSGITQFYNRNMGKKKNQPEAVPEEKKDFQIVILGGGGVGKSCLTFRLVHSEFLSKYDPTIEDSYRKDNFRVNDEICPLEILDTAGQVWFSFG